jgi:ketosteroid isomerase-like protein
MRQREDTMTRSTGRLHGAALAAFVLSVATLSACAAIRPAAIVEGFNREATVTSVRLALEQFHQALRQRNTEAVLNFFVPDTNFRVYDGDGGWLTFDAMRLQDAPDFHRLKSVEVAIDSLYIAPLDPSAAVVADNLREVYTDSAGHVRRFSVAQTMVWTRRADGWKIAHIHSSERPDSAK